MQHVKTLLKINGRAAIVVPDNVLFEGLDIFGLRDDSLEDSNNLPDPDVPAREIVENLEGALEQLASIYQALGA